MFFLPAPLDFLGQSPIGLLPDAPDRAHVALQFFGSLSLLGEVLPQLEFLDLMLSGRLGRDLSC